MKQNRNGGGKINVFPLRTALFILGLYLIWSNGVLDVSPTFVLCISVHGNEFNRYSHGLRDLRKRDYINKHKSGSC